jgi:hypothetical protein
MTDCQLTKRLITEWAREKSGPFPYLEVGEHLKNCLNCLSWSTGIALRPADRYLSALRLKLSDVLGYLGSSLLAVWSKDQDVKISFCVEPDRVPKVRAKALKFIDRYESFSPGTAREAEQVRQMIGLTPDPRPLPPGPRTMTIARLEPYELVRYFFSTALQIAPESEARLSRLTNLGIIENYQALNQRAAGHESDALRHFQQAREFLAQVLKTDVREYLGTARETRESDKTALISARVNLAGTEVQQEGYSETSLHKAVNLLHEALRLVAELGLRPEEFTAIYSNLLISYLRLYLSSGLAEGLTQAQRLAEEICAEPILAQRFLAECIQGQADPELAQLLEAPEVNGLAAFLKQQASKR